MALALPEGKRGQLAALGVTAAAAAVLWLVVGAPLLDFYLDRQDLLARQDTLARRTESLIRTLPELRRAAEQARAGGTQAALLDGATDALAAATLQEQVQEAATDAGTRIVSTEILPAEPRGQYRAIGVRVSLSAPWPALVSLLGTLAQSPLPLVVEAMQLRGPPRAERGAEAPIDASLTIVALRAGNAASALPATALGQSQP